MTEGTRVIGYVRVSTGDQGISGAGLQAQRDAIEATALARGWQLIDVVTEVQSGAKDDRPGLALLLDRMKAEEADALVVAKFDRVSRSLSHFAALIDTAKNEGWALVALDTPVDTTTPSGRFTAQILGSAAEYERELARQRTREGLAVKKDQGVRLGRPPSVPEHTRRHIQTLRDSGLSLRKIVAALNEQGVPTAQGGKRWYLSTVVGVLKSLALDRHAEERRAAHAHDLDEASAA